MAKEDFQLYANDLDISKLKNAFSPSRGPADDEEYDRLSHYIIPKLLPCIRNEIRKQIAEFELYSVGIENDEHVHKKVVSKVWVKFGEKLRADAFDNHPNFIGWIFLAAKNFSKQHVEDRSGHRRERANFSSIIEIDKDARTPSNIASDKENRIAVKRGLFDFKMNICKSIKVPNGPVPKSPLLHLMVIDSACSDRLGYGKTSQIFPSDMFESHTVTRIQKAAIERLQEHIVKNLDTSFGVVSGNFNLKALRPGELIPDLWHSGNHGCYAIQSDFKELHESHQSHFQLFQRSHNQYCCTINCRNQSLEPSEVSSMVEALDESRKASILSCE